MIIGYLFLTISATLAICIVSNIQMNEIYPGDDCTMNLKNRSEYKYFLSDTASFLFCILAVCLIIVSVALICMLNNNYPEHSLKQ
jgi:hypothetical protein